MIDFDIDSGKIGKRHEKEMNRFILHFFPGNITQSLLQGIGQFYGIVLIDSLIDIFIEDLHLFIICFSGDDRQDILVCFAGLGIFDLHDIVRIFQQARRHDQREESAFL